MMQAQLLARPGISASRNSSNLKLTARLKPGVTPDQAQAAFSVFDRQLEAAYPETGQTSKRLNLGLEVTPVGAYPSNMMIGLLGVAAFMLAVVGSVLLIACANVAGM